jgi:CBS domain containing-hemolysin-like protein
MFALRAIFAGSEIAFLSVDKIAVKSLAQEGRNDAIVLDNLLKDMQKIITIVLIGTNLTGVMTTVLATNITLDLGLFGSNVATTTLLMILAVLLFSEIIPKNLFAKHAMKISLRFAKFIRFLDKMFYPLIIIFNKINKLVLRERLSSSDSVYTLTEESIKTMVTLGEEEGSVEEQERMMIHSVFETGETYLRDIMVPRVNMAAADIEDGFDEVIDLIIESGYTRIPVYEDTIDNIIGIINAKDLMDLTLNEERIDEDMIRNILREPFFVPESRLVGDLLHEMRERGIQIAIVLDEYGGTEGLVTLEDIIEEIVGEIQDEYDEDEIPEISENIDGTISVDPRLSLSKISELLGIDFSEEESDTLSGLIYEKLGRVPVIEEELDLCIGHKVKVLEIDGNRIVRVVLSKECEEGLLD